VGERYEKGWVSLRQKGRESDELMRVGDYTAQGLGISYDQNYPG